MKILVTEDDDATAAMLREQLCARGHQVVVAQSGREAINLTQTNSFDVIVLDRMLPVLDGIAVLRDLRARGISSPVLMLTALGGIADRVDGLEAGADDYLVKPFAFEELVARVTALGRRSPFSTAPTQLTVGDISIDLLRRDATRGGRSILIQPREFELLELLMRNAGRVVTRKMFLETVWGFHFDPQTNIVQSHLSRLRSKLREGFDDEPIETVRGAGYRLRAVD